MVTMLPSRSAASSGGGGAEPSNSPVGTLGFGTHVRLEGLQRRTRPARFWAPARTCPGSVGVEVDAA